MFVYYRPAILICKETTLMESEQMNIICNIVSENNDKLGSICLHVPISIVINTQNIAIFIPSLV